MVDKDADKEWEENALCEIAMDAADITVTASCKIIAEKTPHDLLFQSADSLSTDQLKVKTSMWSSEN